MIIDSKKSQSLTKRKIKFKIKIKAYTHVIRQLFFEGTSREIFSHRFVDLVALHSSLDTYSRANFTKANNVRPNKAAALTFFRRSPVHARCKLNSCRQCVAANCALNSEQSSSNYRRPCSFLKRDSPVSSGPF